VFFVFVAERLILLTCDRTRQKHTGKKNLRNTTKNTKMSTLKWQRT